MRIKELAVLLCMLLTTPNFAQQATTPAALRNYATPTSYSELTEYVNSLSKESPLMQVHIAGTSAGNRNLYALCYSTGEFGKDPAKAKVLILAQQHGNEQSGKEAVLVLANELLKQQNSYLLEHLDIALIPQVNPDGSEANNRKNANGADLNRNHVIMTQPETQALHSFFDRYLFDATVDVHEYSPYGDAWKEFGYRKNASVTMGALTNPNISPVLRNATNNDALPKVLAYIAEKGFSAAIYTPGGPPHSDYIRHSTFDVNDGRQSFGIQNTFSFIQEGMNGTDTYVENLAHRTEGQFAGLMGMLIYLNQNHTQVINMVRQAREQLLTGTLTNNVSIQAVHVTDGRTLKLPMVKFASTAYDTHDTLVTVADYRPTVKSVLDIPLPYGYLLPVSDARLMQWVKAHNFQTEEIKPLMRLQIEECSINGIDSIDFEGDIVALPKVTTETIRLSDASQYILIPTAQLKGLLMVQALEPQSILGLSTYADFSYLLKQPKYPILRAYRNK